MCGQIMTILNFNKDSRKAWCILFRRASAEGLPSLVTGIECPLLIDRRVDYTTRKVRRGTQSCWECKRRKVRCYYTATEDSICDGCKRRETTCTSQEFPDNSDKRGKNGQLYDRLDRLEAIVNSLVQKVDALDIPEHRSKSFSSNKGDLPSKGHYTLHHIHKLSTGGLIPVFPDHYDVLPRMLIKAWPSQYDLEIILAAPSEVSGLIHGATFVPFSTMLNQRTPSIRAILQLPPLGSHPVLIAQKLLILATYLQSLSPVCARRLSSLSVNHRAMMCSILTTAHNYVTGNDELLESIEGIECLMIEGMYQNNAGNLRKAWHCINRAVLIAQMINLHRDTTTQSLKFHDTETQLRIHPEYMWFRLVQMNRYLSLMLGLPQGTLDNSFGDYRVLEKCSSTDRMQRMDCVAGGYILQRNEAGLCDVATTEMIEQLLQESAASQSPSWWLVPDIKSTDSEQMDVIRKVVQTIDQLTHFHLVTQLHLPHLVRPHNEHEHEGSKITVVKASREILLRFTLLQSVNSFTSFCRGISLLAFIACTSLCIVHIDAKRQRQTFGHGGSAFLDALADHYERDRNLMVLTLDSMNRMARVDDDPIASKIAPILDHLLSREANTVPYENYVANPVLTENELGLGSGGKISGCGQVLQIHIPYVGTINFERGNEPEFMCARDMFS